MATAAQELVVGQVWEHPEFGTRWRVVDVHPLDRDVVIERVSPVTEAWPAGYRSRVMKDVFTANLRLVPDGWASVEG